eukprot:m.17176 g.17176  ORF g.17176 m.17176 type:complete len:51 (+) comp7352_c1_seq1:193-345(+)
MPTYYFHTVVKPPDIPVSNCFKPFHPRTHTLSLSWCVCDLHLSEGLRALG